MGTEEERDQFTPLAELVLSGDSGAVSEQDTCISDRGSYTKDFRACELEQKKITTLLLTSNSDFVFPLCAWATNHSGISSTSASVTDRNHRFHAFSSYCRHVKILFYIYFFKMIVISTHPYTGKDDYLLLTKKHRWH